MKIVTNTLKLKIVLLIIAGLSSGMLFICDVIGLSLSNILSDLNITAVTSIIHSSFSQSTDYVMGGFFLFDIENYTGIYIIGSIVIIILLIIGIRKFIVFKSAAQQKKLEEMVNERTKELKDAQTFTQNLIRSSLDMIIATNMNRNIIVFNRAASQRFGYSKNEIIGEDISLIYDSDEERDAVASEIMRNGIFRGEVKNRCKDGSVFVAYLSASYLIDVETRIIGFMGVSRDITDIKRTQEQLRKSEERYKNLIENQGEGIAVLSPDEVITFANPEMENIFGLSREKLIGKNLLDFVTPKTYSEIRQQTQIRKSGKRNTYEIEIILPDKIKKHLRITATPQFDNYKRFKGSFVIFSDITEKKQLEQLRDDVDHIIRHDLKSPLSIVIGYSKILIEDKSVDEKKKQWLNYIHESGNKMLKMLTNYLNLYKMEEGKYTLQPKIFDLIQVFKWINREFENMLDLHNIMIDYFLHDKEITWDEIYMILGEQVLLENLFTNLIKNAIEASPDDKRITVNISKDLTKEKHVVSIHNFGAIPENIRDKVFDRYVTSGKIGGTGLGTYSANLICKAHKGTIEYISSEEDGTTFTVFLPFHM